MYFFIIPNSDKQWSTNYKNFNEANIVGRIESVEIINHGLITRLKMENSLVVFKFSPYANGNNRFEEFAKKGDSIIKPPLSDLLVLFKNDKAYEYTFDKK
jgi:hypothetical protein